MRVLIVGGTGLISTAITRELLARGDEVTLFNRGQRPARFPPGARTIVGDRADLLTFEAVMASEGPFDSVIDMICYRPSEAESAVCAFRGRTDQYIFCSTVDVYQKPATRYPYREDEPHGGLGAYALGKVGCEALLTAAHARGDLAVTTLRPAHTYGEGGRFVGLFGRETRYIDRLRKGKPIVSHGDGSSLWASGYCDDVALAFVNAVGARHALGRTYHVTSDEWLTWDQYHRTIAAAVGAPPPRLVHIPTDVLGAVAPRRAAVVVENFQFNNIFDTTAVRADLGFRPVVPLAEGARRTVAWLEANGLIENSDAFPFEDRLIAAWERHGAAMARECAGLDD